MRAVEALRTIAVTRQRCRLLVSPGGYSWVEVWREGELESVCYAEDLHPDRFPFELEKRAVLPGDWLPD